MSAHLKCPLTMNEEEVVTPETSEGNQEEVTTTEETTTEESVEDLKARLAKAEELATNQRIRAEKAETKAKQTKEVKSDLSNQDLLFLAKSDVHEDDMDELLDYAKFKKVPVKDAYQMMQGLLKVKADERRTAAATQVKGGTRGTSKVSGEELLARAQATGEVPEDEAGLQALFIARRAARLKR